MKVTYRNNKVERFVSLLTLGTLSLIIGIFLLLYGFENPLLDVSILHSLQILAFILLFAEKLIRFVNAESRRTYLRAFWYEITALAGLLVILFGARPVFHFEKPGLAIMLALGLYLIFEVVSKACRSCVNLAATGRNPTRALIGIFMILIITGAGLLMLPRSYSCPEMSLIDALFTATSATCVTGLVVKDTGSDFSMMGQAVILLLIQLGGLGIVIFGAVIALLLGQALSVRESVAMQDLLNTQTLGKIGNMIGFIVAGTFLIEAVGAALLMGMWRATPGGTGIIQQKWYSLFHSISAFCNAGFGLYSDSFENYSTDWRIHLVISPLIILGGLGFGVLYNLFYVTNDRLRRFVRRKVNPAGIFNMKSPVTIQLQTKIVLLTSLVLIVAGASAIFVLEKLTENPLYGDHSSEIAEFLNGSGEGQRTLVLDSVFQSITARTAGFNTVDISSLSSVSKFVLIMLMFIGGSPGSTAGGIKTVTFTVIMMIAWATIVKRREVEIFRRSIRLVVVGRAITVAVLFALIFIAVCFALTITEKDNGFTFEQILFETGSALGTVGLTTGITGSLTTLGKVIIIIAMLVGRLGPLTLLASLTFNLKPAGYSYPDEPLIVG